MKNLNEEQLNSLKEMLKGRGWELYRTLIQEQSRLYRLQATQRGVSTEDRWWYSAKAEALDESIELPEFRSTNYENKQ